MTPEFSEAVDPVFLCVLDLLERAGQRRAAPAVNERLSIMKRLDEMVARLGHRPEAQAARKALIYWIDEMLIFAEWEGRDWWNNNKLEMELLGTNDRYALFYCDAKDASALADKDALETFYLCVVLGFRGLYRDPESDASRVGRSIHQLPPELGTWVQQTSKIIAPVAPSPIPRVGEPIEGVYPLEGPSTVVWGAFFGLFLLVIVGMIAWLVIPT